MRKVPHRTRPEHDGIRPVLIILKIPRELGSLRTRSRLEAIKRAFRDGCDRFGMRLLEFSIRDDRMVLLVEARDKRALRRGMQGLMVRLARAINRESGRKGKVFADRYSARALATVEAVRNAIHQIRRRGRSSCGWDEFSTGSEEAKWFGETSRTIAIATNVLYLFAVHGAVSWLEISPKNLDGPS